MTNIDFEVGVRIGLTNEPVGIFADFDDRQMLSNGYALGKAAYNAFYSEYGRDPNNRERLSMLRHLSVAS